jgi:hypothetical protein
VGGKKFKSKKKKVGAGVGSITYLLEFGRVLYCIALTKPRR